MAEAHGLVLPAIAAATAVTTTATTTATPIATTASAIATATATTTATAVPATTAASAFSGSGLIDANHAAHPFDVLKVVYGFLFGRIVS